jgi:hypothetical protein
MGAAIDLFGAVFTTAGGTRYHADPACYALANGRSTQAYRAGEGAYGESWYGAGSLPGLYPLTRRSTISAVQHSYTACLRCVPSAWATQPLPLVTFDYGHRPVDMWPDGLVCARCYTRTWHSAYSEPDDVEPERWTELDLVPWPCASALVLGLVARGGEAA